MRPAPALLLTLAVLALPVAALAAPRSALPAAEENAIHLYETAVQSVVQVNAEWKDIPAHLKGLEKYMSKDFDQHRRSIGSGVLWDDAGHVVTMADVAPLGSRFTLDLADGSRRTATLIGSDSVLRVSVLKIDGPLYGLHPINRGGSQALRVGQRLYVIGSAYGRVNMMSEGLLGAISSAMGDNASHTSLVLNATINPGNAGGPILDSAGTMVGLVEGAYGGRGEPGFALGLPVDAIAAVVPTLVAVGHVVHPRLGVSIADAEDPHWTPDLPPGVPIIDLDAGGAAERAGLKAPLGDAVDVITAIDSVELRSYADLRTQLDMHKPGDKCTLSVFRAGNSRVVTITLEGDAPPPARVSSPSAGSSPAP